MSMSKRCLLELLMVNGATCLRGQPSDKIHSKCTGAVSFEQTSLSLWQGNSTSPTKWSSTPSASFTSQRMSYNHSSNLTYSAKRAFHLVQMAHAVSLLLPDSWASWWLLSYNDFSLTIAPPLINELLSSCKQLFNTIKRPTVYSMARGVKVEKHDKNHNGSTKGVSKQVKSADNEHLNG